MTDNEPGIWNNKNGECLHCGACCYDMFYERLCPYQKIKDGKSICEMHENEKRWNCCKNYFCVNEPEVIIWALRRFAEILGTVPDGKKYLMIQ